MLDATGVFKNSKADNIKVNNWDITISNANNKDDENKILIKNTNINVTGKINKESSLNYKLKIKNSGSIDAYLYSIVNINDSNLDVKFEVDNKELKKGYILKSGSTINVDMIITSKADDTIDLNLESQLVFNQYK